MAKKFITQEQKQRIFALYKKGVPLTEIGRREGLHRNCINAQVKKFEADITKRANEVLEKEANTIIAEVDNNSIRLATFAIIQKFLTAPEPPKGVPAEVFFTGQIKLLEILMKHSD